MVRASIVIPTFGRWHVLPQTVASLAAVMGSDDELIVVDQTPNRPADAEGLLGQRVAGVCFTYRVLAIASLPIALNTGAGLARGDIIIFVDDDVLVRPGFVESHLAYYRDEQVSAVAGHSVDVKGNTYFGAPGKWVHRMVGANMSLRRSVWEQLGGFDENLYKNLDHSVARRIERAGGRIANGSNSVLVHLGDADGGVGNRRRAGDWYLRSYHDQIYMLRREGLPMTLLRWPRVAWQMLRYYSPAWSELLTPSFLTGVLIPGIRAGLQTAKRARQTTPTPGASKGLLAHAQRS